MAAHDHGCVTDYSNDVTQAKDAKDDTRNA